MKTKNLLFSAGIGVLSFFPISVCAQIGSNDSYMSTKNADEQSAQKIFNLEEQLKDANEEVKKEKREFKAAQANAREAKAALKTEKQAQKARKQANAQAKKAEKAMN
jgi:hypothetical protein